MKVEFDNSLVTGNEMIDGQHKELIGKIEEQPVALEIYIFSPKSCVIRRA